VVYSLDMVVEKVPEGVSLLAPWSKDPFVARTFEEAYDLAIRARRRRP
jgi:hypothetical protein